MHCNRRWETIVIDYFLHLLTQIFIFSTDYMKYNARSGEGEKIQLIRSTHSLWVPALY